MKKILFGLMATVLFTTFSTGQVLSDPAQKNLINSQMVALVNITKNFYTKGQSYEGFLEAMSVPSPTYPSQDLLFRKVYAYVSKGTPDCDIMKGDNSELSNLADDFLKNPKNGTKLEETLSGKKWWQNLINWVVNITIDIIAANNGIYIPVYIDLFPNNP